MTTPTDLRTIASDLRDLRRYSPEWHGKLTKTIADRLYQHGMECLVFCPDGHDVSVALVRLARNLYAGRDLLITSPSLLGGYLANAAVELDGLAERLERAEVEPCGGSVRE